MKFQYITFLNLSRQRNTIYFLGLLLVSVLTIVQTAHASWLIDADTFYNSAHGEITCIDCHGDITLQDLHPNPGQVNANLNDFFEMASCLTCHEDIPDDLDKGVHGEEKVDDPLKYKDCISCHDPHYLDKADEAGIVDVVSMDVSSLPEDDQACMACHQALSVKDPQRTQKITDFCFHCHGAEKGKADKITSPMAPLLDSSRYASSPHAKSDCMVCHLNAAQFGHTGQPMEDCRSCHTPHEEKVAHDAHMGVTCEACHLHGIAPVRDPHNHAVLWERTTAPGMVSNIHNMSLSDDTDCVRCHYRANHVGAASMILPPKSVICMPCHAATHSMGDTTTIVSLLIFLAGLAMASSVWLSGSITGTGPTGALGKAFTLLLDAVKAVFSVKFVPIIRTLFYDVFLQRRLFNRSVKRWVIHSLIFIPFIIRFAWGIVGLFASSWLQDWPLAWVMVNKNHPVTAFLYDLTGLMIIAGITMAFLRGSAAEADRLPSLPKQDRLALSLIGGIVLIGFLLESFRMAMTITPPGSSYAVIGYGISKLFSGMTGLNDIYGYLWYIHAILTGAFIAYLPFSRLIHIILAPVVMAMNAATEHETR